MLTGAADGDRFAGYVVGLVVSAEPVPKKDRLTVVKVDIGAEEELQVWEGDREGGGQFAGMGWGRGACWVDAGSGVAGFLGLNSLDK